MLFSSFNTLREVDVVDGLCAVSCGRYQPALLAGRKAREQRYVNEADAFVPMHGEPYSHLSGPEARPADVRGARTGRGTLNGGAARAHHHKGAGGGGDNVIGPGRHRFQYFHQVSVHWKHNHVAETLAGLCDCLFATLPPVTQTQLTNILRSTSNEP